jgi:hypothetical protein
MRLRTFASNAEEVADPHHHRKLIVVAGRAFRTVIAT